MHRALAVPEILDLIMSHVVDRHALAMAARVCRSCKPCAIRWLWNDVEYSALSALCRNLLVRQTEKGSPIPVPERVSRFHCYAGLIRRLSFDFDEDFYEYSGIRIVGETSLLGLLQRTAMLVRSPFLFPNLKRLHARGLDSSTLESVPLFVCSHLEEIVLISIEGIPERNDYDLPLSYILDRLRLCSSLRSFHSDMVFELPATPFCLLLDDCALLEDVCVDPAVVQPKVFAALANHPNLRKLELQCPCNGALTYDGWDLSLVQMPFAFLASLSIHCTCEVATRVLQLVSVSLQEIHVTVEHPIAPPPPAMSEDTVTERHLVEFASSFRSHATTLRVLDIHLSAAVSSSTGYFSFASLSAITKCHQVEELSFHLFSTTCMKQHDKDIAGLAKAFSRLTSISLTWNPAYWTGNLHEPERLTFKAVGHLAAHCRRVESIRFTSLSPLGFGTPSHVEPRNDIVTLELAAARSRLPHPEHVAVFLNSIWPNMVLHVYVDRANISSWEALRTVLAGIELSKNVSTGEDFSSSSARLLFGWVSRHRVIEVPED